MASIHLIKTEVGVEDEAQSFTKHSTAGRTAQHQQLLPCFLITFIAVTSDDLRAVELSALTNVLCEDSGSLPPTQDHFLREGFNRMSNTDEHGPSVFVKDGVNWVRATEEQKVLRAGSVCLIL